MKNSLYWMWFQINNIILFFNAVNKMWVQFFLDRSRNLLRADEWYGNSAFSCEAHLSASTRIRDLIFIRVMCDDWRQLQSYFETAVMFFLSISYVSLNTNVSCDLFQTTYKWSSFVHIYAKKIRYELYYVILLLINID